MAKKGIKVWYDAEGDFLEVLFSGGPGYYKATSNEQVMERVDKKGNILGFSVLRVSRLSKKPLQVALT